MSACKFVDGAYGGRSLDPWCEAHERSASRCVEYLRADLATVTAERDRWEREFTNQCKHSANQLVKLTAMRRKLRETPSVVEHELLEAEYESERAAHAETRKALEHITKRTIQEANTELAALTSTRAELAKAKARVKAAHELFLRALIHRPTPEWADAARAWIQSDLEALRG